MFITKKKFNKVVLELSNRITDLYETSHRTKMELISEQLKSKVFDNYCGMCGPCFESEEMQDVTIYKKIKDVSIIIGSVIPAIYMINGFIYKELKNIQCCQYHAQGYNVLFTDEDGDITQRMNENDFLMMVKYKTNIDKEYAC